MKGKNHNSILFLATLGVYFGLVLVGGSAPQVFAHSATTRQFEIQDEIEVRDDLDKKPDDKVSTLADSVGTYLQDVEYIIAGLQKLARAGKLDLSKDTFEAAQSTLLPCVKDNRVGSYTADGFFSSSEAVRPILELFGKRLTDGYSLPDCLPSERFSGGEATSSRFRVRFDNSGLSVEVAVKKRSAQEASQLAIGLGQTIKAFEGRVAAAAGRKIYQSTTFTFQNDQVFVVTRLPRAALISLLSDGA